MIKEENIPESYFEKVKQTLENKRVDVPEISPELRSDHARIIITDQKESLDKWFDYFLSRDSNSYPIWAKYWACSAMLKMGKFDHHKGLFTKRTKGQIAPFPDLNREVLAKVVDAFVKKVKGETPRTRRMQSF